MSIHRTDVLRVLAAAHRPLGIRELLQRGGFHPGQQTELKRVLRELVRAGEIDKEGKRFLKAGAPGIPPRNGGDRAGNGHSRGPRRSARAPAERARVPPRRSGPEVEGILHVHPDGFGFVHPLRVDAENVYLPPHEASRALDGDRVRIQVVEGRGGRSAGILVEVVDRIRQRAVGVYREEGRRAWVLPSDRSLPGIIRVPATQLARNGDAVKVVLGVGAKVLEPGDELIGEVTGSLGHPGEPSAEVVSIVFSQGFSDEFPAEAMAEADAFDLRVLPEGAVAEGRRDLRSLPLVTIDGADARDFDDGVYAERASGGWRLVVAIADVAHYVTTSSALDAEAQRRGTSVYLPDRVLPMLPERLSNGICSLRPDEDRLCMVADMRFDEGAGLREYELYPAVMRSLARCTYEEVQDVLDGRPVSHRQAFRPQFENLMSLARALNAKRRARGAIDFDLPEYKVMLDERGMPVRLERRPRVDSHRLIEECMLAANEAVAQFFRERELPSVYRFHGSPDEEKLETFAALARAHGFNLGATGEITAHQLNRFLEQLEGHPERRVLNQLLLRSMMQAVYSAENVGHYGLGAEHYLHFTSPIRRYPDLLVHRLLKEHWGRGGRVPPRAEREAQEDRLEELAVQSSERERAAVAAEREVVAFYSTLMLKERIGEEFSATVSSLADFGFFIELDELHVEGLVKAESLGGGHRFDTERYALIWPNGRRVKVGERLRARLISANVERRQLDFEATALGDEEVVPVERERPPRRRFQHPDRQSILGATARRQQEGTHRREGKGGTKRGAAPRRGSGETRGTTRRAKASGSNGRGAKQGADRGANRRRGGGAKQGGGRAGSSRHTRRKRR